jgi:hypothetical protein
VYSSVTVAKLLHEHPEIIQQEIIPAFKTAVDNKGSWRLRFAVAEMAASLAEQLTKMISDEDILTLYVELL